MQRYVAVQCSCVDGRTPYTGPVTQPLLQNASPHVHIRKKLLRHWSTDNKLTQRYIRKRINELSRVHR